MWTFNWYYGKTQYAIKVIKNKALAEVRYDEMIQVPEKYPWKAINKLFREDIEY